MKKILLTSLIIFLTTGCAKVEVDMTINKNKSMELTIIEAIEQSLIQEPDESIISTQDLKDIKQNGYKIEKYKDDNMVGHKFIKSIKNIDEISTKNKITGDLSIITNEKTTQKLFTIKKGIFKNKYIANIKSSDIQTIKEQTNTNDQPTTGLTEDQTNNYNNTANINLNFTVKLPYKALKNNATEKTENGKNLTWNLNTLEKQNIEFEFELYNTINIYITIGIIIAIITIIIQIIKRKNKQKIEPTDEVVELVQKLNEMEKIDLTKMKNQPNIMDIKTKKTENINQEQITPTEEIEVLDLFEKPKKDTK